MVDLAGKLALGVEGVNIFISHLMVPSAHVQTGLYVLLGHRSVVPNWQQAGGTESYAGEIQHFWKRGVRASSDGAKYTMHPGGFGDIPHPRKFWKMWDQGQHPPNGRNYFCHFVLFGRGNQISPKHVWHEWDLNQGPLSPEIKQTSKARNHQWQGLSWYAWPQMFCATEKPVRPSDWKKTVRNCRKLVISSKI